MNEVVSQLSPKSVFKYFNELCNIPRGSGNEKKVSNYLVNFAKENNLEFIQDKYLNVIIKKQATVGYENAPVIILQGHMDMVCEKNKGTDHDFEKDPLNLRIEGDLLKATDTTLGADNGVAVAYCMAILSSDDISHPPLEVLITTEEETGMGGASNLNSKYLEGKILINIDSEEEGELLVSCAGGVRCKLNIPLLWEDSKNDYNSFIIKIRGLKGGHSGMEINKERGNANKLLGRVLSNIFTELDIYLYDINGGAKMNAIPREADAKILLNSEDETKLKDKIDYFNNLFKNELKSSDKDIRIEIENINEDVKEVINKEVLDKIIKTLLLIPNGIQSMSMDIKGLVQSSTNLGVVTLHKDNIVFESAVRSSIKSLKYELIEKMKVLADLVGGDVSTESDYPEWQYNPESYIRDVFVKTYKELTDNEPKITAIHAGLECGILKEKLGDIDIISFGPNMYDVHTPQESLSISSTERTWEYLLEVLKNIK